MKINQKDFAGVIIILAIVVILAAGGAVWYFGSKCNSWMDKDQCEKSGGRFHVYTVMKNPPGSGSQSSTNCECGAAK
jgi:flagellar basal body-associated protein FliL